MSLHCVVEPALGNAGTGGDTPGSFPHDLDGFEEGIDAMRCVSSIQCETHDGAAYDVELADRVGLGQFLIQQLRTVRGSSSARAAPWRHAIAHRGIHEEVAPAECRGGDAEEMRSAGCRGRSRTRETERGGSPCQGGAEIFLWTAACSVIAVAMFCMSGERPWQPARWPARVRLLAVQREDRSGGRARSAGSRDRQVPHGAFEADGGVRDNA